MPRVNLIQLRGGTAAEWTTANPVLAAREKGVETDTGLEKIGNGATPWNSLPYQSNTLSEFNRTWSAELLFDKSEIDYAPHEITGDVTFTVAASGHINNKFSSAIQTIITDGTHSINFSGFDYIYGIENGDTPDAGRYQVFFLYRNGVSIAQWKEPSSEIANLTPLATPGNFVAVPDGEDTIDLTWDNVVGAVHYHIEFSETGTGGWTTLSEPAAGSTSASQTGLAPGVTRFYRIKAIGNNVSSTDSAYATANATTESSGDVTAPTFTFLPANGNDTWTVNRSITITANEPIRNTDGSEITNANVASRITLKETNSGGANILFSATIDASKTIVTITPTTIYGANQLVYVAINNVEDVNGNEVTVAQSITFTTTEFSFLNGTSNRLIFGDIMDPVIAANDAVFALGATVKNLLLSGARTLWAKHSISDNQRGFIWYTNGADVYFGWYGLGTDSQLRLIKWTGVLLDNNEHVLRLEYTGSIDTNNGLDRLVLKIDGVTQGSKTIDSVNGSMPFNINSNTAQLSFGISTSASGIPVGVSYFTEEAKDLIIESAGAVVEINVPIVRTGTDVSGNSRNGTWV